MQSFFDNEAAISREHVLLLMEEQGIIEPNRILAHTVPLPDDIYLAYIEYANEILPRSKNIVAAFSVTAENQNNIPGDRIQEFNEAARDLFLASIILRHAKTLKDSQGGMTYGEVVAMFEEGDYANWPKINYEFYFSNLNHLIRMREEKDPDLLFDEEDTFAQITYADILKHLPMVFRQPITKPGGVS